MQSSFWSSTVWIGFIFLEIARLSVTLGFPGGASGKESVCQCWKCRFNPWFRKVPWNRQWHPTPVFLPEKCYGQWNLVGYSPWNHKELATTTHTHTHTHTRTHIYHSAACNSPLIYHLFCQIRNYNRGASLSPFPHLSVTRFSHIWHFMYYTVSGHLHKSQASRKPVMAAFAPRIN